MNLEHLSDDWIRQHLDRALAPQDVVAVHIHTAQCAQCRERLASAASRRLAGVMIPQLEQGIEPHLSEDEMVAWVAGTLAETRKPHLSAHLDSCAECAEAVRDLESVRLRQTAAKKPVRRWVPMAIAAGLALAVSAASWYRWGRVEHPVLLAALHDSPGQIGLTAGGSLAGLAGLDADETGWVASALRNGHLPAAPSVVSASRGVLRAPGASARPAFELLLPAEPRVLPDRPEFRWQALAGAKGYEVVVTTEALDPVTRSGRISATTWQPAVPLPRGRLLLWQVRAWTGGAVVTVPEPPEAPASFQIVAEDAAIRIQRALRAPHPSHLLLAILYVREGLTRDAARELQALSQMNPTSPVAASLQADLASKQ